MLETMKKNGQNNFFSSPFSALLLLGCLPFVNPIDRQQLLQLLGQSPATSNDDIVKALKELAEKAKKNPGSTLFWCLAIAKSCEALEGAELLAKVGLPVMKTTFPEPALSEINRRVEDATLGIIKNLFGPSDFTAETQRVLVNAISFKGSWVNVFEENEQVTWQTPGCSPLQREFMLQTMDVMFAKNGRYRYVSLPFEEKKEMEMFMTEDKSKLPLELSVEEMNEIRLKAKMQEVFVSIPRWELREDIDLRAAVVQLTGLPTEHLPRMKQVAFIHVDEKGVVAAAASGWVEDGLDFEEKRPETFIANRPFLYTIRAHGVTEYMGYMHNLQGVEDPPCATD